MAGFLDLTGLSRFKSKLLEAIANVYVTKTAHSKALNLKVNKADLESEIKRVLGHPGWRDHGLPRCACGMASVQRGGGESNNLRRSFCKDRHKVRLG